MKKPIIVLLIISLWIIVSCKKNDGSPTQPNQQQEPGDTVATLSPGTARVDFPWSGGSWLQDAGAGTCTLAGDSISLRSSYSISTPIGSNAYAITLILRGVTTTDTITLGPATTCQIRFRRTLYGSVTEDYSSQQPNGSGTIRIIYFSLTRKTIKGTFNCSLPEIGGSGIMAFSGGTFKGTWQ